MAELRLRRTPSWRLWRRNEAEEEEEPEPRTYRYLDGRCLSACIHWMY